MKTISDSSSTRRRKETAILTVALALFGFTVSCKRQPARDWPVPEVSAAEVNPVAAPSIPPVIENSVREKGDAVATQAFGVLSSRLGKAIADAGYTNAIQFCSVHGIALTSELGVTNDAAVRRVTHRPRNPQNRASTNELALIRQFEAGLGKGATPRAVIVADKPGLFTYYAPIVLNMPLCLNCHGSPGTDITPETLAQIRKSYPADEATGFKLGQLRGLWSVDFKRTDFVADADK